jgi:tetratricopeptide (TPR) repeat protein
MGVGYYMASTLTPSEAAQLAQTIEMFEVITQSQPQDYQSLEILKEAYSKLGRDQDVIQTSKRIAQAYVQMGQLSSAILEYETILQRFPNDPDVQAALQEIESKANTFPIDLPQEASAPAPAPAPAASKRPGESRLVSKPASVAAADVDDGRRAMQKIFVETKTITQGDFDLCWPRPDTHLPPGSVTEPFIQVLADRGVLPLGRSLKLLVDKGRFAYLPLNLYDVDIDLARRFPADTCQRWCVLPFDRMSKTVLVATVNPYNQQAASELTAVNGQRLLWYLVPPSELTKNIRKAFR